MSSFDRVAWKEGVYLLPQHFQQMEVSLLAQGVRSRAHRRDWGYGILALEFDEDGLSDGHILLKRLVALLPSGEVLDMPRVDPLPQARSFDLRGNTKALSISISLPRLRAGFPYTTDDSNRRDVPHIEGNQEVEDLYGSGNKRSLLLYKKNSHILLGKEVLNGAETLKIAEIQRGDDGRPCLSVSYTPPSLVMAASAPLRSRLKQLVGAVRSKMTSLRSDRGKRVAQVLEMTPNDIQSFLFLQTLQSHLLALEHLVEGPDTHPALAYGELLRLYGALLPFQATADEKHSPYDHQNAAACFETLDQEIRKLLDSQFKSRYEIYTFKKDGHYHVATLSNKKLLKTGHFILVATANVATDEIMRQLPGLLHMSDRSRIDRLVRGAVRGIEISPLNRPPPGLPVPEEAAFFRVRTTGEHWESVTRTGEIVASASGIILPNLSIRLIGLRNEGSKS